MFLYIMFVGQVNVYLHSFTHTCMSHVCVCNVCILYEYKIYNMTAKKERFDFFHLINKY